MAQELIPEDEDKAVLGESVQLEDEETDVEDTEDGGAIIRLKNDADAARATKHFANIVDEVDRKDLKDIVSDLLEKIEHDKEARKERDRLYEEGLRRTGLGKDAPGGASFAGANKVVHPMLVEACVDFSARVMKEIFPPNGPVRSKIIGDRDPEKLAKADRKAEFMNWQTTEQMPEFRGELEQLSTQLPLGGAQYLKLMWNAQRSRPQAEFVAIDDIRLPFAATNFYSAERKTHVQYITAQEYRRRVKVGMYADVDLPSPEMPEFSKASKANDKIEGRQEDSYNSDGLRTVFEVYVHLDIEDIDDSRPYILSIDKSTGDALALYRNWEEDDQSCTELEWIIEFPFIPWRGAFPIGLSHMIGGLAGGATGALRALLDSAHIQNVPTLLKLKGGPGGQTLNVQPTEVVEIEGGAMVDDIRKIAMALPFNGPSPVLFQLMGFLVDAGKGVVQTSFEKLSDTNTAQPVGTTMALIEQGMVVFSSIHSRLHASMARVFKVLHRINSAYLTDEAIKAQVGHEFDVRPQDFDGPLDVIPVSDPAIFSETQRFAQTQAILQRAAVAPQMYDARKVEEMFLKAMKLDTDLLNPKPGQDNMDPVSENVAASMGRPIYVLPKQEHLAHIKAHLAFLQSPLFGQNPVIIKSFLWPMAQHLRDHLLNYYLVETHKAASSVDRHNKELSDADGEVEAVVQVQQLIEQQLAAFGPQLAQIDQMAQQFKPQPQMPPDNSMQVAQMNVQLQKELAGQKAQLDQARLQQSAQADQTRVQLEQAKMQQSAQLEQQKLGLAQSKLQQDAQRVQADVAQAQMHEMAETQRNQAEIEARISMNDTDNATAMQLAQAEMLSGEKTSYSTGTGINPGV